MRSINFNEGVHEYAVNGDESRVIKLRLEPGMVGRFEKLMDELDEMINNCPEQPSLEQFDEIGEKLCKLINSAFRADVCGPAFGGANPLVPGSDGKPLYQAFFESFIPAVTEDIEKIKDSSEKISQDKKASPPVLRPEVQRYIAKPYVREESIMPDVSTLSKEQKAQLIAQLLS